MRMNLNPKELQIIAESLSDHAGTLNREGASLHWPATAIAAQIYPETNEKAKKLFAARDDALALLSRVENLLRIQ